MIIIKEPHIHKEALGSVTITEEVSQSWSDGSGGVFAPQPFGQNVSPLTLWTWTFNPLTVWTRTFRPWTFWTLMFRAQDVSHPDFLDHVVSPPDIFGPGRFAPCLFGPARFAHWYFGPERFALRTFRHGTFWTDQDVSSPDNCFIIQNICFSWKFCQLGEFKSNFSWRCFTIHVTLCRYVRDYATLLEGYSPLNMQEHSPRLFRGEYSRYIRAKLTSAVNHHDSYIGFCCVY